MSLADAGRYHFWYKSFQLPRGQINLQNAESQVGSAFGTELGADDTQTLPLLYRRRRYTTTSKREEDHQMEYTCTLV